MNDLVMHTCPEVAAPYLGMVIINGSRCDSLADMNPWLFCLPLRERRGPQSKTKPWVVVCRLECILWGAFDLLLLYCGSWLG